MDINGEEAKIIEFLPFFIFRDKEITTLCKYDWCSVAPVALTTDSRRERHGLARWVK